MEKREFILPSDMDQLPLSTALFLPEGEIKGIFQISHGMAEHKERYFDLIAYLTAQGYVTIIHDHRGHGKSVRTKENLGYFYDRRGTYIVEDLHQVNIRYS